MIFYDTIMVAIVLINFISINKFVEIVFIMEFLLTPYVSIN